MFLLCGYETSAYKRDAKSFVLGMDAYVTREMDSDTTYKQGTMQTVSISIDGEKFTRTFHGDKVKDVLYLFGVDLEDTDNINLDLERPLCDGDEIIITSESGCGDDSFIHFTPLLPDGKVRIIFTNGKPNPERQVFDFDDLSVEDITPEFLKIFVDSRGLSNYKRIWVYVGDKKSHISALTKGFEDIVLDINNQPVSYLEKFDNLVSVAYSSNNRKAKTNSGRTITPGSVAVRTSQFPYGTRLFIVSADGSFVYGNAVAADTGDALRNGTCDLDVAIDSYEESCWFGKKHLTAYVLEWGSEQPE